MFSHKLKLHNIVRPLQFGTKFFHNSTRNAQQKLAQYQFNNVLFWNSRNLQKPVSSVEQTKKGRKIRKKEINKKMKGGPFGILDHILKKREQPLGQCESDMEQVSACINWFWNHPELHVRGNVYYYKFRETPGFFTKIDIWKGEKIQVLIHIFNFNKPQSGVIHNHNHGFYFQNISLHDDAEYKTSQFEVVKTDENEKNEIYVWKREANKGELTCIPPIPGSLKKTYEHNYKNGIIGFTEQNTLHQVKGAKGQVISFIVREADYHGEQKIYSTEPNLPEDQDFKVQEPGLKKKEKYILLLRKIATKNSSLLKQP